MTDQIIEIIKAEIRPGYDYKPVQVAGKGGVYWSHRWFRKDQPGELEQAPKDRVKVLHDEAKRFLKEQMHPRRMELRQQWQGWIQHKSRLRAEMAMLQKQDIDNRLPELKAQYREAMQYEKQYRDIYQQYRKEHEEYAAYVKELAGKLKQPRPQEKQAPLFDVEQLTEKPQPESLYPHEFDSSPKITQNLAQQEIMSRAKLGDGINGAYKVRLADGTVACWKMRLDESYARRDIPQGRYQVREAAAYEVSEALGFHVVPPTTVREDDFGEPGSIQLWDDKAEFMTHKKAAAVGHAGIERHLSKVSETEEWKTAIFDVIIGNEDRHALNFGVRKDGTVACIDNGLSFGENFGDFVSRQADRIMERYGHGGNLRARIPDDLMESVRNVDWNRLIGHIQRNVGERPAVCVKARVQFMLEHGEVFNQETDNEFRAWADNKGYIEHHWGKAHI